jgi:hypothetical protein
MFRLSKEQEKREEDMFDAMLMKDIEDAAKSGAAASCAAPS